MELLINKADLASICSDNSFLKLIILCFSGKHMDAIVVENKQVASDCIRYLKDQRIGLLVNFQAEDDIMFVGDFFLM